VYVARSEGETLDVARALARRLVPGSVVLLEGDLGAGKTTFVRGLAAGLGLDPDEVSSPTFALIHEYRDGTLPLFHVDLYRLEGRAAEELGLEELQTAGGVLAIEWPDRLTYAIPGALVVRLEPIDEEGRRITITREA
jgi:tRNA threonylcarbamoyladenosine biosynthesis protein TsaE